MIRTAGHHPATPTIVESPHRDRPSGAPGVGGTAVIPPAPTIGDVAHDATGVRFTDPPPAIGDAAERHRGASG